MKSVAALVMAAGASSRLGSPKQLVRLGAETLLERAVRVAREAGCSPVVVVLGALADVDGCVVMTCDMPAVTVSHLQVLMSTGEMVASSYAGRRGVPAYFPA